MVLSPRHRDKPEITGNLMKMRTENTAGVAQSYRDQAEYGLLPPPNLLIDKGVIKTDKPNQTYPAVSPLQDNKPIEQGGTATFQINVSNRPQTPVVGLLRAWRAGVGPVANAIGLLLESTSQHSSSSNPGRVSGCPFRQTSRPATTLLGAAS